MTDQPPEGPADEAEAEVWDDVTEDTTPTEPGPSPYADPEIDTTGPQDEVPGA